MSKKTTKLQEAAQRAAEKKRSNAEKKRGIAERGRELGKRTESGALAVGSILDNNYKDAAANAIP